ncbi:MAG: hypothetical protein QXY40_09050 [Candidatus Methanomethylicia archaeon]
MDACLLLTLGDLRGLQTLLDACSMIIAELELRKPSSYSEVADILTETKLLNGNEASKLKS